MAASRNSAMDSFGSMQQMMASWQGAFGMPTFGMAGQGYESMLKSAARCQIEAMSLLSRRGQAYLELPTRLGQCHSPQDLIREHLRFWQMATTQYMDTVKSMSDIVTTSLDAAKLPSTQQAARATHDYITFPEPKSTVTRLQPGRTPSSNRGSRANS